MKNTTQRLTCAADSKLDTANVFTYIRTHPVRCRLD